ncbi:nucleotide-binding universal stress UspA family protein [Hamadaea flava]|uniref:Universal stress protein n=1 Tax=Hamadaea flava TaxID=1742688 RepID=A0ABV8LZB7_9ACTN|nr:universal stress protein [Hamadaea flava]MCP2329365.1 nucleotide-binding universal stress UspA family protein [Hamadaea flava]
MSSTTPVPPVVAGVDGSPSSLAAARYAAHLAELRDAPLSLVYGFEIPVYGYLPVAVADRYYLDDQAMRADAETMLAAVVKQLTDDHPGLADISARAVTGGGAAVLLEESRHAQLTVVGCRGLGGFTELLLGSVSAQVSAHAHGPVVVVRPPVTDGETPAEPVDGPIVVGVDSSPGAQIALKWAVDEARRRNTSIIAVYAFPIGRDEPYFEVRQDEAVAEQILFDAVSPWLHQPGVTIETRTVAAQHVEKAMIDQTIGAGLTVVGGRGGGGFTGLLLGSVSRALVHHAHGPVAVIHPAR